MPLSTPDKLVIAVCLHDHRYVFVVDDTEDDVQNALMTFGRFASNPAHRFTWSDASACAKQLREIRDGQE